MTIDQHLHHDHPLSRFYRRAAATSSGALLLGAAATASGAAPLAAVFPGSTSATAALGLATGGLVLAAATGRGARASDALVGVGGAFTVAAFLALFAVNTTVAFPGLTGLTALFLGVVGLVLLLSGSHGRFSGGLGPDNPYARHRAEQTADRRTRVHPPRRALAPTAI